MNLEVIKEVRIKKIFDNFESKSELLKKLITEKAHILFQLK